MLINTGESGSPERVHMQVYDTRVKPPVVVDVALPAVDGVMVMSSARQILNAMPLPVEDPTRFPCGLVVNRADRTVEIGGSILHPVASRAFDVLSVLSGSPRARFTADELIEATIPVPSVLSDPKKAIEMQVGAVRMLLGDTAAKRGIHRSNALSTDDGTSLIIFERNQGYGLGNRVFDDNPFIPKK